jgi:tripartite-type tricarboxylate transporter receptor subunit TctC
VERFGWTEMVKSGDEFQAFLAEEEARVKQLVSDLGLAS